MQPASLRGQNGGYRGESVYEQSLLNSMGHFGKAEFLGSDSKHVYLRDNDGTTACLESLGSFRYEGQRRGISKLIQHPDWKNKAIWLIREDGNTLLNRCKSDDQLGNSHIEKVRKEVKKLQDEGLRVWIYASQEIEWTAESDIEKLDKRMLTGEWKLLGAAVLEESLKEGAKECF